MKTIIILILSMLFYSCSKERINPVEKSVTYLHHYYNGSKYLKTDVVIQWCKVSGEELARFEAITPKKEPYCDNDDTLELRIAKACPISSLK